MICMRRRMRRSSLAVDLGQVDAVELHRAGGRLAQADHRPPGRALAAARLADEAERLALADLEGHVVDRLDLADRRAGRCPARIGK